MIPHDQEEAFSVLQGDSQSQDAKATRLILFSSASSKPITTFSVPFGIRNCLSYPLTENSPDPAFVAITHQWGVVLIGKNLKHPQEGSTAKEIIQGSSHSRRTLFQDIFGQSAFAEPPTPSATVEGQNHTWDEKTAAEIFDCPAYLMPPLEHLFKPLINGFLKLRSEDPVAQVLPDEDVDMEEEISETILVRTRRSRPIQPVEMNTFVELFRKQSVKG